MNQSTHLELQLGKLQEVFELITARGKSMYEADKGALYGVDFLAGAALNRTLANSRAFIDLVRSRNLVIGGALLRIQLDTAMRFYAVFLVDKPHDFAIKILEGERLDLQKDRDGKKLSDRYLADKLNHDFPWVKRVYQTTSGYIHLSGTHIHHTMSQLDNDFTVGVKLSPKDRDLPDELYVEAIEAFIESINILLKYIDGWIFTKANPELAAEEKRRIEGCSNA
jgi:hypothetical protein